MINYFPDKVTWSAFILYSGKKTLEKSGTNMLSFHYVDFPVAVIKFVGKNTF